MLARMESLEQLMHAAQQGDKERYRKLLEESARLTRGFICKRISRQQDVDDIVQEVLLAIHKARHTYHSSRPYKPWLYALASYKLNDYLRTVYRRGKREELTDLIPETVADEDVTIDGEISEELDTALSQLSERQQVILRKTKIEGYSNREVAEELGMTESAVKVTVHRAMKQLQKNAMEKS